MTWLQVTVQSAEDQTDHIEGLLEDLGALSITLQDAGDDPIMEPDPGTNPLWQNNLIIALFSSDNSSEAIRNLLEQQGIAANSIEAEMIENRDWEREWMSHFQPMHFGNRLQICPSWHTPSEPSTAAVLNLDPGLAFGTGTHPTTSLCLSWLESQNLHDQQIIDYGCGSGILALAALTLGADKATGIDIDPQALEASQENARRNQLEQRLDLYLPHQLPSLLDAGIVLANILANPLISLAPSLAAMTTSGGKLALSGILRSQEEQVCEAYQPFFEITDQQYMEDWALIVATRLENT